MPTDATLQSGPPPDPSSAGRLKLLGLVALVVAIVAVVWGVLSRESQTRQAQGWSDRQAAPTVAVITPTVSAGRRALSLPGDLAAENAAQIYARVSGYLKTWRLDIGAHAAAGELLATLDTPDLDQQVTQAQADLVSAQATRQLSATTARRWTDLLSSDAVSKQETDEKTGDLAVRTALVLASKANLDRLLALRAFSRITAPFAGVITARNANIGDLVNAGAGSQPLFVVSDVSKIRVYVHVPQTLSAGLQPGVQAQLRLPEISGRTFPAAVVATSGAISGQSGTLLVELSAANPDGALKPGAYVQVDFDISGGLRTLNLPASALLFRKEGLQAAVLDHQDRVHLTRISVARDLGQQVEVASGVEVGDRIIDNPPDSIAEGEQVHVAKPPHG